MEIKSQTTTSTGLSAKAQTDRRTLPSALSPCFTVDNKSPLAIYQKVPDIHQESCQAYPRKETFLIRHLHKKAWYCNFTTMMQNGPIYIWVNLWPSVCQCKKVVGKNPATAKGLQHSTEYLD